MPLQVVGHVPFRPLGSSHFVPAPWQHSSETPYRPSVMSEAAMANGVLKSMLPLRDIDESLLTKMEAYLEYRYGGLWGGDNLTSYPEAVSLLNLVKSPGHPYYYTCEDKECTLNCFAGEVQSEVASIMAGEDRWSPFTLTLKDELRTADRVAAQKTRVFSASNIVHLLVGKCLFTKQELKLRAALGQHPVTIGVGVPGPQFVKTVLSLGRQRNCWFYDIGGCDQKFLLQVARIIRNVRCNHLPPDCKSAVHWYYDSVYGGYVICCGCVHVMLHNKSGHELTADDTSIYIDGLQAGYVMDVTGCAPGEVPGFVRLIQNGDDGACSYWDPRLSGPGFREWCAQFGVDVELERDEPCFAEEGTFLSHSLRERFVPGLGDVIVAAGNRAKLQSSIEWLRLNQDFGLEENALMHLLGLRINMWPWKSDFEDLESLIDSYVDSIETTPEISRILKARIPESKIIDINFRLESSLGCTFFSVLSQCGVDPQIISAILLYGTMPGKIPQQELARRAAQSKRDKAAARSKATSVSPQKQERVNSGFRALEKRAVPAAQGFVSRARFSVARSNRYKDGIVVEGWDHLEYVSTSSSPGVGVVLNEIYINPSEFGGTRLEKYAALYEKYLFEKLDFEYVPGVGSNVAGSIGLAYDRDISDPTPQANEQGVRQYTSFEGAVDGNVWTPLCCKNKLSQPDSGYYTNPVAGGDDRLSYQGQFYVYVVEPPPASQALGRIRLHFKCHLFTPQLENSIANSNTYVNSVPPTAVQTAADFLARVASAGSATFGVPQWKPIVDSLGKYYIPLTQGVYRWSAFETPNGTQNTTGSNAPGSPSLPVLVPNEPMPASAPQPWIYTRTAEDWGGINSASYFGWAAEGYMGVPRGGAKMYMNYNQPPLSGGNAYIDSIDLTRLGGFAPSDSTIYARPRPSPTAARAFALPSSQLEVKEKERVEEKIKAHRSRDELLELLLDRLQGEEEAKNARFESLSHFAGTAARGALSSQNQF